MKTLLLALVLLSLTVPLSAQGKGKGKGHSKSNSAGGGDAAVSVIFTDSDRRVIQRWTQSAVPAGLPPGLAKRGELPPGLQKQLRRGGSLPPGLQKKISPFPETLITQLPPLPVGCGCDRIFLDGKALIIARATGAILDLISLF
jgi:hypothetical protein